MQRAPSTTGSRRTIKITNTTENYIVKTTTKCTNQTRQACPKETKPAQRKLREQKSIAKASLGDT